MTGISNVVRVSTDTLPTPTLTVAGTHGCAFLMRTVPAASAAETAKPWQSFAATPVRLTRAAKFVAADAGSFA